MQRIGKRADLLCVDNGGKARVLRLYLLEEDRASA